MHHLEYRDRRNRRNPDRGGFCARDAPGDDVSLSWRGVVERQSEQSAKDLWGLMDFRGTGVGSHVG